MSATVARSRSLTDVHKSFGPTAVIMGVSLDVARGSRHAIIGPNGAGKTTLFNLISGRFPVSARHASSSAASASTAWRRTRSTGAVSRAASRSPRSSRA